MDDRRTPMEAEVQELPLPGAQCRADSFYGTSARPRTRRSHAWLWICVGLAVIAVCTFSVVGALSRLRLENGEGGWRLAMGETESTEEAPDPVRSLEVPKENRYVPAEISGDGAVRLSRDAGAGAALSAEEIYRRVSPSVVCIQAESYFGTTVSTGVILTEDGYILTAAEGLKKAESLSVSLPDGTAYSARRIGEDRNTGVCLLKAEVEGLSPAVFASDAELSVGQRVYCVCNPYGSSIPNVFYEGMLSVRQELDYNGSRYTVLQSSILVQNNENGCPIVDDRGRVIGLNAPIGKRLVSGTEACLAVSAADLDRIVASFENLTDGQNWLGLDVEDIPEEYRYFYGFPGSVWITDVAVGTPAYGVLLQYDVITAVDGVSLESSAALESLLASRASGDFVRLTIYRSGSFYSIVLPVLER